MQTLKYYIQEDGQYRLKNQKLAFIIFGSLIIAGGIALGINYPPEKPANLYIAIILILVGILIFLRSTAKVLLDVNAQYVSLQPFSFSKPKILYFKDFDGFNVLHITQLGIKGTSTVGMLFIVNGKKKEVKLRQTFMTTKSLHKVVKETEQIMGLTDSKAGFKNTKW